MRWVIRFVGLVVCVVAAALVGLMFLPSAQIVQTVADQVRAQTGLVIRVGPDVSASVWPKPGVQAGPVEIDGPDWAGSDPMFQADSLRLGLDPAALLHGELAVARIEAEAPLVRLFQRNDGAVNWQRAAVGNANSSLQQIALRHAMLILGQGAAVQTELQNVDVTLNWPETGAALNLEAVVRSGNDPVLISANIRNLDQFLAGLIVPLTLQLEAPGADLTFVGRASLNGAADGKVRMQISNSALLFAMLGKSQPDFTQVFQSVDLTAAMTFTQDHGLSLRDIAVRVDKSRITGGLDYIPGDPTRVTATLTADVLDASALAQMVQGWRTGAETGSPQWSEAALDMSWLDQFQGAIGLAAGAVDFGNWALGPSQVMLTLDRSRAVLQVDRAILNGGLISGQVVANNRDGLSVGGDVQVENIQLDDRLMRDLPLTGHVSANLKLLAIGSSVAQWMRSLSGSGAVQVQDGAVTPGAFGFAARMSDPIRLNVAQGQFEIVDGVLTNDDLTVDAADRQLTGAGQIGIADQTIDYHLTRIPDIDAAQTTPQITRISGAWQNPSVLSAPPAPQN